MKALWEKLSGRIDGMTLRERIAIFVASVAVLVFVLNALVLEPLFARNRALAEQVRQQDMQLEAANAGVAAQIVHFVGGDTHEIQRAGISKAIMVKPRAEPDVAIGIARQHVLFDEIVNDHIDGGKRRLDRLGNGVSTGWRSGFVKVINNLKRAVDTADARALGRLRVRVFGGVGQGG